MKLILASQSPRRRELFELMGLDFSVVVSDADESIIERDPALLVKKLALLKAEAVAKDHQSDCIVGADTVVAIDGEIIGKPKDDEDARNILMKLSGRTHTVYTGVAVISPGLVQSCVDETQVTFCTLSDELINAYIASGEPRDKAGAYGVQGIGSVLVEGVSGCYFTVIGMPVPRVFRMLKKAGIQAGWTK